MQTIIDASFGIIPLLQDNEGIKVLIIQHNAGHWGFPKGHKEAGKTDIQTALREIREETGISHVDIVPKKHYAQTYEFDKNGQHYQKTVTYFPAYISNFSIALQEIEIQNYRIIPLADLLLEEVPEETKRMLEEIVKDFQ